jgi:hypothetical protein
VEGDEDRPDRILVRAAAGAGEAGDRQGVVGPELLGRPGRHRDRGLGAHGAVLQEQALRHVQELHLRVVGIADAAAGEELRGAADVGEGVGQQAAGGRLGHGEALVLRAEQVGADLGQRVVP